MSKHTPGPWVWDEDGAALRTIGEQSVCILQDGEGLWNLWNNTCLKGGVGAANARLIAAAPDLLEALRKIAAIENKMVGSDWEEIEEARDTARAAIAAVEGEKA